MARRQLLAAGLGRRAIEHRLATGRLHAIHQGVYAVGHRVLSREARWMAAVLAAGPGARLSHRPAAALWGLRGWTSARIDVTIRCKRRSRPGIVMHRGPLPPDEVTVVDGIPTTTVPRTLLDLAALLPRHQIERAVNEAEVRRLTDSLSLGDLVSRYPRRRGVATIRAIVQGRQIGAAVTRSELEARFLALLDAADLPRPSVNLAVDVAGRWIEADCVWPTAGLIVELDGHASHGTTAAYERDRARDRAINAAGWRVVRVTWRQLHDDAEGVVADLHAILASAGCVARACGEGGRRRARDSR